MAVILNPPSLLDIEDAKKSIIFLAGGISNCPDWQSGVASKISKKFDGVIVNPRRENWNMDSQSNESIKQIEWEHSFLIQSDVILFWFPKETLCPITLFELGAALERGQKLFIGCHVDYQRKLDVIVQSKLVVHNQEIFYDLDKLTDSLINYISG